MWHREAWQRGTPVEELVAKAACRAEYHRWITGDISSRDLVDKWGGDVMRIFQAWYVQGKTREDVEGAGVGSDTMRGLVTGSGPRTDEEVQVDSLEMMIPDVPADPSCELSARRRWQEMTMSTGHMEK